jgi:hypothetical protein
VKNSALIFFVWLALVSLTFAQSKRIPPGIREADKADASFEKSIPPPQNTARIAVPNFERDAADAAELAKLAQSVQGDVEQMHRGLLPAGLKDKLKRIEKLSKRLREGLNPR